MILEMLLLGSGLLAADEAGVIKLGLTSTSHRHRKHPVTKKPEVSTAPVPSAQHAGALVAPSIPGSVIPAPNPLGDMRDRNNANWDNWHDFRRQSYVVLKGGTNFGQGLPYSDVEGYWRDQSTGKLYQFHDPNTGTPIGRPGYMPVQYEAYTAMQPGAQAAQDAAAASDDGGSGTSAGEVVATGLKIAGTAAAIAAGVSDAAGTAAAVAGVAGSILACLGPLPATVQMSMIEHRRQGWRTDHILSKRVDFGARRIVVTCSATFDDLGRGTWHATLVEVSVAAAERLDVAALYADHGHRSLGKFSTYKEAEAAGDAAIEARFKAETSPPCDCAETA